MPRELLGVWSKFDWSWLKYLRWEISLKSFLNSFIFTYFIYFISVGSFDDIYLFTEITGDILFLNPVYELLLELSFIIGFLTFIFFIVSYISIEPLE